MQFPLYPETERMRFRLLNESDTEAVFRQFSDPDMCRYFSDPPCDIEEAGNIILHYQPAERCDFFRYAMLDKATGVFIGTCGYHYLDKERMQVEIGYDVWKDFWRQGYISEALPVLINNCFDYLGVDSIYVLIHPQNEASIASVRKFGFRECEPCRTPDTENEICMKLLRNEWLYNHPAISSHTIFPS